MTPDQIGTARSWVKPCEGCGLGFKVKRSKAKRRFCSQACQLTHCRARTAPCGHCGLTVTGKLDFRNAVQYCNVRCYQSARSAVAARERATYRKVRDEAVALRRIAAWSPGNTLTVRPCKACGRKTKGKGEHKRLCSPCKAETEIQARRAFRRTEAGRAAKSFYKARRRKAEVHGEPIDPIKVFARDGWVCHMCKCDTPKELRGTYQPNAPELDHVVPLALGGTHTWDNVRCACRSCNGAKGAKHPSQFVAEAGREA